MVRNGINDGVMKTKKYNFVLIKTMRNNNSKKCMEVNNFLGIFPQHIIYYFNKLDVRNYVINSHITKYKKQDKFSNFGTINIKNKSNGEIVLCPEYDIKTWKKFNKLKKSDYHDKNINDFFHRMKNIFLLKPKTIFTVCLHYNKVSVHFVSFIYNRHTKELVSFDPGVQVYEEGQEVIVPTIKQAMENSKLLKTNTELGNKCYQHRYFFQNEPIGIQYNSKTKDAFCQNWTLYFLVEQIKSHNIIRKVCRIHPANREIHLFRDFIIPILRDKKKFIHDISFSVFIDSGKIYDANNMLKMLQLYISSCKTHICSKKKVSNSKKNQSSTNVCLVNSLVQKH